MDEGSFLTFGRFDIIQKRLIRPDRKHHAGFPLNVVKMNIIIKIFMNTSLFEIQMLQVILTNFPEKPQNHIGM